MKGTFRYKLLIGVDGRQYIHLAEETAPLISTVSGNVGNLVVANAYTPSLADVGKIIRLSDPTLVTFTLPSDSVVKYPLDTILNYVQWGAGQIIFQVDGNGVVLDSAGSLVHSASQFSVVSLWKVDVNLWLLSGSLA